MDVVGIAGPDVVIPVVDPTSEGMLYISTYHDILHNIPPNLKCLEQPYCILTTLAVYYHHPPPINWRVDTKQYQWKQL